MNTATLRRAIAALAIGALSLLLSACMLTSETFLVDPTEAVQPLSPSFAMVSYSEGEDGVMAKSEDAPGTFALGPDGGYAASDGSFTAYFLPTGTPDGYTLALNASDGAMYGTARLRGDILEVSLVFTNDPATELGGGPLPPGATVADAGITVTDRAALDAVLALVASGKLTLGPLVAWVGAGEAPATLKRDGDWYAPG